MEAVTLGIGITQEKNTLTTDSSDYTKNSISITV